METGSSRQYTVHKTVKSVLAFVKLLILFIHFIQSNNIAAFSK